MEALAVQAFRDTVRLIPTGRLKPSALLPLVRNHGELVDIQVLEMATSARLMEQSAGLGDGELVFDRPNHSLINAAFCYPRPTGSRFNSSARGAWYAALAVTTSLREVTFHLGTELAAIGRFDNITDYAELFADFDGLVCDLRRPEDASAPSLASAPAIGYPAGQCHAAEVRARSGTAILYPSVRHAGGTCLAILRPASVLNVRQGGIWRLEWRGEPEPVVARL